MSDRPGGYCQVRKRLSAKCEILSLIVCIKLPNRRKQRNHLKTKPTKPQKVKLAPSYKGHRYPTEIIEEAVWLYFNFALSYREVEMLLLRRGIEVTYETIRQWCLKFGQAYANDLRRRRPRPGDKWHLDEVVLKSRENYAIYGGQLINTG